MLEIRAFGPLEIRGSPDRLEAIHSRPTGAALLAYLVLHQPGMTHRLDGLTDLFWPALDPDEAREALAREVAVLRRELPAGVLEDHGANQVGVVPKRVWCDVLAFEDAAAAGRWREALELYRGDLLEGLDDAGSDRFRAWLTEERELMRQLADRARRQVADGDG